MATLVEPDVIQAAPTQNAPTEDGACGSACGSGCGSPTGRPHGENGRTRLNEEPQVSVPFSKRRLNLDALPSQGTVITSIDMDLTVECNLRCTYCFKEKWNEHMEEQVAFDTMIWLIHASGPVRDLRVAFMAGLSHQIAGPLLGRAVDFVKGTAKDTPDFQT